MGFFDFLKRPKRPEVRVGWTEFVEQVLRDAGATDIYIRDTKYSLLPEKAFRAFVYDVVKVRSWFVYHSCGPEFPDCDDASLIAHADVIRSAVARRFKDVPCFGQVSYMPKDNGGWHRANWAIFDDGRLMIYEPQNGRWKNPADEVLVWGDVEI